MAVQQGIIERAGTWFSYSNEKIGQGRENVSQYLKDNPKTYEAIYKQLMKLVFKEDDKQELEKKKRQKKEKSNTPT